MNQMRDDFKRMQINRIQKLIENIDGRIEKMLKTKQTYEIRLIKKKKEL